VTAARADGEPLWQPRPVPRARPSTWAAPAPRWRPAAARRAGVTRPATRTSPRRPTRLRAAHPRGRSVSSAKRRYRRRPPWQRRLDDARARCPTGRGRLQSLDEGRTRRPASGTPAGRPTQHSARCPAALLVSPRSERRGVRRCDCLVAPRGVVRSGALACVISTPLWSCAWH
jgi:hypothetical protein